MTWDEGRARGPFGIHHHPPRSEQLSSKVEETSTLHPREFPTALSMALAPSREIPVDASIQLAFEFAEHLIGFS